MHNDLTKSVTIKSLPRVTTSLFGAHLNVDHVTALCSWDINHSSYHKVCNSSSLNSMLIRQPMIVLWPDTPLKVKGQIVEDESGQMSILSQSTCTNSCMLYLMHNVLWQNFSLTGLFRCDCKRAQITGIWSNNISIVCLGPLYHLHFIVLFERFVYFANIPA